jgi:hypothetical protein
MALKRAILDKIHAARVELRTRGEKDTQDAVVHIIGGSKTTMVRYWQASNPETFSHACRPRNPKPRLLCVKCARRISTMTKLALVHKRAQGQRTGGDLPYGFTVAPDGKTLVAEEREQTLIACVRREHRRGTSLRGIVALLATCGFTTRQGTPLSLTQVHRFITRIRGEEGEA